MIFILICGTALGARFRKHKQAVDMIERNRFSEFAWLWLRSMEHLVVSGRGWKHKGLGVCCVYMRSRGFMLQWRRTMGSLPWAAGSWMELELWIFGTSCFHPRRKCGPFHSRYVSMSVYVLKLSIWSRNVLRSCWYVEARNIDDEEPIASQQSTALVYLYIITSWLF